MQKMTSSIDPALLAPIGSITVNFALLEQTLSFGVWLLLFGNHSQEQRTGQIVTAELSFRRTVELFSCLFRHRFPKAPDAALPKLCGKLVDTEAKRNTIIHSCWAAGGEAGYSHRFKITSKAKGFGLQFQKMSAKDLLALAEEIAALSTELQNFQLNLPS